MALTLPRWLRRRSVTLREAAWRRLLSAAPMLAPYARSYPRRLRERVETFLATKTFAGGGHLVPDAHMRGVIALHACVPALELGLDWYDGWSTVIVYPEAFYTSHEYVDDAGLVHAVEEVQSGEAWLGGPVVLSWPHVATGGVVIHEFAHKLDMCNGVANGMPPLHRNMSRRAWTRAFTAAYEDFCALLDAGDEPPFDEYAGEDPSEFFAVASEVFFIEPRVLCRAYADVYAQLRSFYRLDPLALRGGAPGTVP